MNRSSLIPIFAAFFSVFLFGFWSPAKADIIHVPADTATVQGGIDLAKDGDTVLVAHGFYTGSGNEAIRFNGKKILLKSESGPEVTMLLTLDTVRTVIFDQNEDSNSVLDGFTITAGYDIFIDFDWNLPFRGGIKTYGCAPMIKNCLITGCYASQGGAVESSGGRPIIRSCVISNNHAEWEGGGLFANCYSVTIEDSRIQDNRVGRYNLGYSATGGGLSIWFGYITIRHCSIVGNQAGEYDSYTGGHGDRYGGGIHIIGGIINLDSITVAENSAGVGGGLLIELRPFDELTITHSLVYNNTSVSYSGLVYALVDSTQPATAQISHCTFACNYSALESGDGVAVIASPWMKTNDISRHIDYARSDSKETPSVVIKDNIFAFTSSAAIYQAIDNIPMEIYNNDVWHTVSGPSYGGVLSDLTGANGNLSADPLFCSVSDSGFALDVSSPCVETASDGGDIGAFAAGCDLYQGGSPKMVTATLLADVSFLINQDSLNTAFAQTCPWDTLYINYTGTSTWIKPIVIDYPLYIIGNGLDDSVTLRSDMADSLGNVRCMELRSFCIIDRFRMVARDLNPYSTDTTAAIGCRAGSPIVRNCELIASGWHEDPLDLPVAVTGSSPLIRNCAFSSIISRMGDFGARDVVASGNYWFDTNWSSIDDAILDGKDMAGAGYVYFQPFLTEMPTAAEEEEPLPQTYKFELFPNYPNPFNRGTIISYRLPRKAHVRLTIYNVLGQTIRTLIDSDRPAGSHSISWDGSDNRGKTVASGVYFYRLESGQNREARKMILLK